MGQLWLSLLELKIAEIVPSRLVRVMHTVLCCRVILHLRSAARRDEEPMSRLNLLADSGILFRNERKFGNETTAHTDQSDTIEMVDIMQGSNSSTRVAPP